MLRLLSLSGARKALKDIIISLELQGGEDRRKINIGKNDLVFVEAPMLHWPDSMFTYLTGKNILMPNDAFGQHYATAFRFNDQVDQEELYEEALKYYANILTPFSRWYQRKSTRCWRLICR